MPATHSKVGTDGRAVPKQVGTDRRAVRKQVGRSVPAEPHSDGSSVCLPLRLDLHRYDQRFVLEVCLGFQRTNHLHLTAMRQVNQLSGLRQTLHIHDGFLNISIANEYFHFHPRTRVRNRAHLSRYGHAMHSRSRMQQALSLQLGTWVLGASLGLWVLGYLGTLIRVHPRNPRLKSSAVGNLKSKIQN
jgi:hypothetical protein